MKMHLKTLCAASLLAVASFSFAADWAPGATDWDKLPEIKRTKQALYLTPQQAYDMKKKDPKAVALFDVRTRSEAIYVGMATDVDALVPFVEHPEIWSDWDDKRHMYKLEPNQDFVPEFERRMKAMGLGKDAPVVLICRSGDLAPGPDRGGWTPARRTGARAMAGVASGRTPSLNASALSFDRAMPW